MKKFKERIKAETKLVSFKYLFVISNIIYVTKKCVYILFKL